MNLPPSKQLMSCGVALLVIAIVCKVASCKLLRIHQRRESRARACNKDISHHFQPVPEKKNAPKEEDTANVIYQENQNLRDRYKDTAKAIYEEEQNRRERYKDIAKVIYRQQNTSEWEMLRRGRCRRDMPLNF